MEIIVWFEATLIAMLYFILGPIIIPRILKKSENIVHTFARIMLSTFFIFCAFTHLGIAYFAIKGFIPPNELIHHALLHLPQVIGGYLFLLVVSRHETHSLSTS